MAALDSVLSDLNEARDILSGTKDVSRKGEDQALQYIERAILGLHAANKTAPKDMSPGMMAASNG